jgi:sugar phosphate isomerase/epimerase
MKKIPRRKFVQSLTTAIAAPAIISAAVRSAGKNGRLPIAFSTLGCPKWDWKTIITSAAQQGYAAIELRGILDQMDLTKVPEFMGENLKASMKDLSALGLKVSDLGASAMLHEPDQGKRSRQMDEAKRFIDLAYQMKASYVRVFPNQFVKGEERKVTMERIIGGLRELGQYATGTNVVVVVESHGDFVKSPDLLELMRGARMSAVAFLWDAHHTCVGGEKPEETWSQMSKYVRHTHLKDSLPGEKGRRYVLTGTGEVPVKETVRVLSANNYKGYYCFEWEKRWHPEIEEPEIAFPHYAKTIKEYLAEAGTKE